MLGVTLFLYNILFTIFLVVVSPYYLFKVLTGRENVLKRLGFIGKVPSGKLIWHHGASCGEVKLLSSLVRNLRRELPEYNIMLTAVTKTGIEMAKQLNPLPDKVTYLPVDAIPFVLNFLLRFKPRIVMFAESELWVNSLVFARLLGARLIMVNARLSSNSFKIMRLFRPLVKPVLHLFSLIGVRGKLDKKRFANLTDRTKIDILGELKFASQYNKVEKITRSPKDLIFVAGSVREGEEKPIIEIFESLRKKFPSLVMVLAPRHPERFEFVASILQKKNIPYTKYSQNGPAFDKPVLLLDAMGKLVSFYSIADVAFVGGSLVNYGGHNPLEPAYFGVPTVMGKYFQNTQEVVEELKEEEGIKIVPSFDKLQETLETWLSSPEIRKKIGKAGRNVTIRKKRVVDNYMQSIKKILQETNDYH